MAKWAFYNDVEPFACEWLRNLIKAGLIPDGEVDSRSIGLVQPEDVRGFAQCHWFSGLGGWPYALRLAGWDDARPVWTGSCPCQPFSVAGRQGGTGDDRHLWPEFYRLITACRPPVVFGEQVASAARAKDVSSSRRLPVPSGAPSEQDWLDGVFNDLEGAGHACRAAIVPACSVNAPHRRDRLWFVAHANGQRLEGGESTVPHSGGRRLAYQGAADGPGDVADAPAPGEGWRGIRGPSEGPGATDQRASGQPAGRSEGDARGPEGSREALADPSGAGLPHAEQPGRGEPGDEAGNQREAAAQRSGAGAVEYPAGIGCGEGQPQPSLRGRGPAAAIPGLSGGSHVADADRHGPHAGADHSTLGHRGAAASDGRENAWANAVWLPGADGKLRRVGVRVRHVFDGLPANLAGSCPDEDPEKVGETQGLAWEMLPLLERGEPARVGKLKALGNAIVPQVAAEIIGAYMDCFDQ